MTGTAHRRIMAAGAVVPFGFFPVLVIMAAAALPGFMIVIMASAAALPGFMIVVMASAAALPGCVIVTAGAVCTVNVFFFFIHYFTSAC